MELEGRKELVCTGKSSRAWSVPTVSLRLAVLNVFQGFFGPKMAVFGPKLQFLKLRSVTCESHSRPPPSSFLLKLCVIVLHTHRYHPPKFHPNPKHHNGSPKGLESGPRGDGVHLQADFTLSRAINV